MANELQPLSILFQNRLFRIPDYQRGYAWKHEQLADFWEDLLNLHEERYHYTGLLSLKAIGRKDVKSWDGDEWLLDAGHRPFHVVDGQQRLTTFSILVNEIATFVKGLPENTDKKDEEIFIGFESLQKIKEKYIVLKRQPQHIISTYLFGYEADNPSAKYLKYKVFEEPNGGKIDETYYTKNLKYAKNFFFDNLRTLYNGDGIEAIERLYRKLTQKLMFNLHEIEDDYDVFVAFETMNNRGKKLTNLELLKNRLIYLTTLFDDNQLDAKDKTQLRHNINEAWKEVYHQLGRNQNSPLNDDEFLRAHWITYFRYSRKGGDDYIRFLLGKFSAKNVYEKHAPVQSVDDEIVLTDITSGEEDDTEAQTTETEIQLVSKLAPKEIDDYVKSLQMLAEYWYYSFFPEESNFSDDEKLWIDRLNRIGIAYYRPLVAATMATSKDTDLQDRIALFKAIERFIFVEFRLGGFQANYQSSVYYNKSRDVLSGAVSLASVTDGLNYTVDNDMDSAIRSFQARTKKRLDSGVGYYGWHDLRYFLFEYEYENGVKNKLQKVDWRMFTHAEKDKVTIEHILPQTPSKWYWQNTYRMYDEDEIWTLSISLGNLLPLSQSINSSLQNDSFPDKKKPSNGRRGYANGSHSELEVAQEDNWAAQNILNRGMALLAFMESRWNIVLTEEQKAELLHVEFVNDGRDDVPEIPKNEDESQNNERPDTTRELEERHLRRFEFWSNFVRYCKATGRGEDVASRKAGYADAYDVSVGSRDYHIFFQIHRQRLLRIGMYIYRPEDFERLDGRKQELEAAYGSALDWYSSREKSVEKRILHSIEADVHDETLFPQHFQWLIDQFDKLITALRKVDDLNYAINDKNAIRRGFRSFLNDRVPEYKAKDTLVSDAYFIDNNPELFDYSFQEVLATRRIPATYVTTLEQHFKKRGVNDPRNNTRGYVKALELLLEYLGGADEKPALPAKHHSTDGDDIGYAMTKIAYRIAKQVYDGIIGRSEGKDEIARQTGMNPGSAGDYISAFLAMMDGVEYKRTINELATKYFVNQIRADYGEPAFRKAIEACEKHAKYYAALGRGRLAYVERIVSEST